MAEIRPETAEAFARAYTELSEAIFRHCYFRVFHRERARELMQETFMRTWEYLLEGKSVDNLKAFLYRVARNLIIDESRKHKALSLDMLREEGFEPCGETRENLEARSEAHFVIDNLARLDEDDRELIILRHINELHPAEIAEVIHEKPNVVSVRLHRATQRLCEILKQPKNMNIKRSDANKP